MPENKVLFNLKNVHYAKVTAPGYATPVAVPGAVSLSLSPEGENSEFFADGVLYYKSYSNSGYSGDLELAKVPDIMLTDIWGYTKDSNEVFVENASVEPAEFALLFQIDGDKSDSRFVLYSCSAQRPGIASKTNEKRKEPQTQSLSLTAAPLPDGKVQARTTGETPDDVKNAWFDAVYTGTPAA